MTYFASGVRPSMFDLALLHARLASGVPDEPRSRLTRPDGQPCRRSSIEENIDLAEGSGAHALFRERVTPSLAASDLSA